MSAAPAWDDEEFITECLTRGEAGTFLRAVSRPLGKCRWCTHIEHGLMCTTDRCRCDSAFTPRDDSWRPSMLPNQAGEMAQLMHETGCDGWTARLATTPPNAWATKTLSGWQIKSYLMGRVRA